MSPMDSLQSAKTGKVPTLRTEPKSVGVSMGTALRRREARQWLDSVSMFMRCMRVNDGRAGRNVIRRAWF